MNLRIAAATLALVSVLCSAVWGFICPSQLARRPKTFQRSNSNDGSCTALAALQKKSSISATRLGEKISNDRKENNDQLEELLPRGEDAENFDGKGFAGYLAPYAFAFLVASIATGLFFKFVLMADYSI